MQDLRVRSLGLAALMLALVAAAESGAQPAWFPAPEAPGVLLDSDLDPPQPIGTTIRWTVTVPDGARYEHRFRVDRLLDPEPGDVILDFEARDGFDWTPPDAGVYVVRVESRNRDTGELASDTAGFWIAAPEGDAPSVLPTRNPLVVLYSAGRVDDGVDLVLGAGCWLPRRCRMRVVFRAAGEEALQATAAKPLETAAPTSFYVAGLREQTRYELRHEVLGPAGEVVSQGPVVAHETPAAEVVAPAASVRIAREAPAAAEPVLLFSPLLGIPYATDLEGRLVWYDATATPNQVSLTRAVEGGTFLELARIAGAGILREVDLAGSEIRRTTQERVNQQLLAMGQDPITAFHHEARRLPGGRTAVLGTVVREVDGLPGERPSTVIGDSVIVLDPELQVEWVWNAFDHLDVARAPTLGDLCLGAQAGCLGTPPGVLADDWTHSNAIEYSPQDGNLLVSVRNQDWIVKIDYADGRGSGAVVWRLGAGGDFSIESANPFPWHSHAHDPFLLPDGRLAVYDNANTRCALGFGCDSRGQVYELDEDRREARLVENVSLERFVFALGSAHGLRDGGFHFGSGIFGFGDGRVGSTAEEVRDGGIAWSLFQETLAYRSFRMRDLYSPPPGPSDGGEADDAALD